MATYGWVEPMIGVIVAFAFAVGAIRWLLQILSERSLAAFAWYRLAVAGFTLALLMGGAL